MESAVSNPKLLIVATTAHQRCKRYSNLHIKQSQNFNVLSLCDKN